jgi:hypothetical protein
MSNLIRGFYFERTDPRLGRHVVHDDRSRGFDLARHVGVQLPAKPIRWERHGLIFDQGDLGCCTACAALGLMMTEPFTTGDTYTLDDAHAFYHDETVLDGIRGVWPPDDTGSSGLAAMRVLRKRGRVKAYSHAFSPTVAVAALARGPIAVGTVWLESMFAPKGGRIVVDRRSPVAGGHEYVVDGWDPNARRVHMTNSRGNWGDHGGATLSWDDFSWLLSQDGDAVQPTA